MKMKWNKIENALPDDDITVLVATEDGEVDVAYLDEGRWRFPMHAASIAVTHWMHIPDHPENS